MEAKDRVPPPTLSNGTKWILAILIGFLFAIISSNFFYSITNSLSGCIVLHEPGGATLTGILIHMIIFILVVRAIL